MSSDFSTFGLLMPGSEVVAPFTVPHVELIADDGKEHGMCTEQQLPILNGVEAQIWRDFGRSTPVPACAMAVFGLEHRRDAAPGVSLVLLRHVSRWKRGILAEEELFHVLRDEFLRLLLKRHQAVLVQDHLHAIFPLSPRVNRHALEDALAQFTRPRWGVEPGQLLLQLDAEDRARCRVSHEVDCTIRLRRSVAHRTGTRHRIEAGEPARRRLRASPDLATGPAVT